MAAPERQCIACRERGARDDLLRLALAPDGTVLVDLRGRLPGRGAWLHPTSSCVETVQRKSGLLARALKAPASASDLLVRIRVAVEAALADGLSLAAAGGGLVSGADALRAALGRGEVVEVAVASDAADRTVRTLRALCEEDVPMTMLPLDRDDLGRRIGAPSRAAVGILPASASIHLRRQLQRLRRLG